MPPPNARSRFSPGAPAEAAAEGVLAIYRGLTLALSPFLPLLLARRAARGKADAARVRERYGEASHPCPAGRIAWVHAASVGETLAMVPLVTRIVGGGGGWGRAPPAGPPGRAPAAPRPPADGRRPSIRAARCRPIRGAVPQPLAA